MEIFADYLWQIVVALGGSLVTMGLAIWRKLHGQPFSENVLWPTVACVVIASVGIALQARQSRLAAEKKLSELLNERKPAFKAEMGLAPLLIRNPKGFDIYLHVEIIGQGAASVAYHYRLKLTTPSEAEDVRPSPIPMEIADPVQHIFASLRISPSTDLAEKTSRPVSRGEIVSGWLRFSSTMSDDAFASGPTLRVSFLDYLGNEFHAEGKLSGKKECIGAGSQLEIYCPGLR